MPATAEVRLWGRRIGAVSLDDDDRFAWFEYEPAFAGSGIEVSPLGMPLATTTYRFPQLAPDAFHGLPGMLADSLPDRYGNALIDAWLATQGRSPDSFDAVERLCYLGARGMGALEFAPAIGPPADHGKEIDIGALADLAAKVLAKRDGVSASLADGEREQALQDILSVGTSAGGARPKAVIAWNPQTHAVRSGQVDAGTGFEHWLLKFDGVEEADETLSNPKGYGAVELAYSNMARAAGIAVPESRLLSEGGRRHFMVKRFDRTDAGAKLHMQSLGGLAHLDYNQAGAHSYEQALLVIRQLGLGMATIEQQFRRMAFNVVARNQDDHVKNIAFLMGRDGRWSLSPAFDLTFAYRPDSRWTGRHQMSVNGKRDDFAFEDLRQCSKTASMARNRPREIVEEVTDAVRRWPEHAAAAGVPESRVERIASHHRLALLGGLGS
jgi:serine/threonine-protein kinase HipA